MELKPAKKILFVLIVVSGLIGVRCSSAPTTVTAEPDGPILVEALQARPEQVHRQVEVVGTLAGNQEVTLSSEVPGRVAAIHKDLGDRVSRGEVLVELDPTDYELAVERQRAALGEVLAQLGVEKQGDPLPELSATSLVRRAAAEAAEAKANYTRIKTLLEQGVVSRQVYDSAEARYRTSQANQAAALEQARNLRARVENLQAQLRLSQENLEDSRIRAPFAGTVRERLVEVGQFVRDQTPVLTLASMNPLKLRASFPERLFPYVQPGAPVEVLVEAYAGETFSGKVLRVARAGQTDTRTFSFEALLENPTERLRPGLFARAILHTAQVESVFRIPARAVISYYGVQKVYAIENGVIREKVVKLGDRLGELIEITEGLQSGDWVATSELARLQEGVRVQVQSAPGGNS